MVDFAACQSYGMCIYDAPEAFSFDDDGLLVVAENADQTDVEKLRLAADNCPVGAIRIVEPGSGG